ncbi:MAG: translesion error-prone DNA polymerase V autoproteolytic subunit [Phycisphaerae bacterium]|nr:translesion error-prone DNA polymerase V autoproteolytic subunit [Phycisphaerae bacterium]
MNVEAIYKAEQGSICLRPLFLSAVAAGFPSPAEEYIEGKLDLNKHLISNPASTYFVRVTGESMINAGIHPDDMLVVDRAVNAKDGDVVIACIDGELTVKTMRIKRGQIWLVPENKAYQQQKISDAMDFTVWGVVRHVIHSF